MSCCEPSEIEKWKKEKKKIEPHAQPQPRQPQHIVGVKQALTLPQLSLYDAHCIVQIRKYKNII